jgi:cytochrome c553
MLTHPTGAGTTQVPPPRPAGGASMALGLVVLALSSTPARAQSPADIEAGRTKAQACAVCHGQQGISNLPNAPHLAAQPAIYLAEQLKAYRNGSRRNEVMAVIAKPLSDDDIQQLAAFYASLKIEVVQGK